MAHSDRFDDGGQDQWALPGMERELVRSIALEELESLLLGTGGVLGEDRAAAIAAFAGCSARQVYRYRAAIVATWDEKDLNLLQRLERYGASGFVLDDVWWTLYYWSVGNAARVLRTLSQAGYTVPSPSTASRRMRYAPDALVKGARTGLRDRHKNFLYTHLDAVDIDEVHEADECVVDLHLGPLAPGTDPL